LGGNNENGLSDVTQDECKDIKE